MLCQACGTVNDPARELCSECGCRLLIMSGASVTEVDAGEEFLAQTRDDFEENIFERLTNLEEAVRGLSRSVAGSSRSLGRLEENLTVAHAGVEALGELLERQGIVTRTEVVQGWEQTAEEELLSRDLARRFKAAAERILAQTIHSGHADHEFRNKLRAVELALLGSEHEAANQLLTELAGLAPASDELWSFIGEAAFQAGELEAARIAFRRVLDLRGPHFETLVYLGAAASDLGRFDEAEAALRRARDMAPDSALPHFTLGALEVLRGGFRAAVGHLERSLDSEEMPQSWHLLGICRLELGQSGRAVAALERAVELAPELDDALYDLGVALLRRGWTSRARNAFEQVLQLDPQRLQYQATAPLLRDARRQGLSKAVGTLVRRAATALERGQLEHALDLFTESLAREPHEPVLRATAALAASAAGRFRDAVAHSHELLRQAPDESPCTAAAVVALLESLRQAGRPRAGRRIARGIYEDARLDPLAHAMAAYELAVLESEIGDDLAAARELAREALETTPKELRHHPLTALGAIAFKSGRSREAAKYHEQAARSGRQPRPAREMAAADPEFTALRSPSQPKSPGTGFPASTIDQEMLDQLRRVAGLLTELNTRHRAARRETGRWTE